jgi:hypothetical protein
MSPTSKKSSKEPKDEVKVRVSVHAPGGLPYMEEAAVNLKQRDRSVRLKRVKGTNLYEGAARPGVHTLEVSAAGLRSPNRPLVVTKGGKTASAYLGKRGWPFYRLGENVVPFESRDDLLAVAFEARRPGARTAAQVAAVLREKQLAEPFDLGTGKDTAAKDNLPFAAADGAIWVFRLREPNARERAAEEVRRLVRVDVRFGIPVDLAPGQVKVIDNRFVIRFRDHLKPDDIERLVKEVGGVALREFIQAGNARLVEFRRGGHREHLQIVEDWFKKNLLVYGEPDVMAEITDDVFPADPPDDPTFGTQANLTLQNVDEAWQFMNGLGAALTLGDPDVYIATLDRGVQTTHPDVGGNLTDGTPQLAQCHDFSSMQTCTAPGYDTESNHGMGVYGIVAARTDNGTDIAGIAPNTHQLGILRPDLLSVNYPDVLLWMAGFTTGNATPGWAAEPISPGADIISCSHGSNGLALSGIMDDTLTYLSTYGRGGRGTLVIYSAGNGVGGVAQLITGFRVWAAHPRTMAISNSDQPDGMGVERKHGDSNFGPEIDICAQGHNAPSLNDAGGEQTFGGTSASAPTVAAAAGLLLSAEPGLSWIELRDILRDTAVIIDPANANAAGQWIDTDADGVDDFSQWYGHGRLDVQAAVEAADGFDPNAVNLVIRDNLSDDGTVLPSGGTFWRSPDLWVRTADPATDPVGDPAYDVAPPNENAVFGQDNWVRVRVRNFGTGPSSDFFVRAYLTHFAGSQFQYPADFIPSVNTGDPLPSPLVQATYLIGEQAGSALAAGGEQIFDFLWPDDMVPPEEVGGVSWHPCLLAEVTPHTGLAPTGDLVVDYSNLAQRNIGISYDDDDGPVHEMAGVIGHEQDDSRVKRIVVSRGRLPKKARVWVRFLDPKVERAVVKHLAGDRPGTHERPKDCCCPPGKRPQPGRRKDAGKVVVERREGRRVFRLASGSRLVLDVPMAGGPQTPVVVGVEMPPKSPAGSYDVPLIEQELSGRVLGAFSLEVVVRR